MTTSPPPAGPVASVAEAVARMQQVEASLPAEDGVACFNAMAGRCLLLGMRSPA